jgi:hypothetical protein
VRHTPEEILHGLEAIITYATDSTISLSRDMKFYDYVRDHGQEWFDGIHIEDFVFAIEGFFELDCGRGREDARQVSRELSALFGLDAFKIMDVRVQAEYERRVAESLTFGTIADFIAEHAPYTELRSIDVLGKPCAPAGAFRAIQDSVKQRVRKNIGFGPSTRILDALNGGNLEHVWEHLRWLSHENLPPMPSSFGRDKRAFVAVMSLMLTGLAVATCVALWTSSVLYAFLAAPFACGLVFAAYIVRGARAIKPPDGFDTFRDVALAMAGGCSSSRR